MWEKYTKARMPIEFKYFKCPFCEDAEYGSYDACADHIEKDHQKKEPLVEGRSCETCKYLKLQSGCPPRHPICDNCMALENWKPLEPSNGSREFCEGPTTQSKRSQRDPKHTPEKPQGDE